METAGFQIAEGVLSIGECDALVEELCPARFLRGRAGARHLMSHPAVASLARREGLLAIARRWVGSGAVPYRATLFEKAGVRNWLVVWHQDTALPLGSRNESTARGPEPRRVLHFEYAASLDLGSDIRLVVA